MPHALWIYVDPDPAASGELRRLGVAALAMEGAGWTCSLLAASEAARSAPADVAIVPLDAVNVLPAICGPNPPRIIVEIGHSAAASPERFQILASLANRIDVVVARGRRPAQKARNALKGAAPVLIIPDPAERTAELAAAAMRFGLSLPKSEPVQLPEQFELWFAEPGDLVEPPEIEALARAWRGGDPSSAVAVARPEHLEWLRQAGVRATFIPWSPAALDEALSRTTSCMLPPSETYGLARRRRKARRKLAPVIGPQAIIPEASFDPLAVGAAWRSVCEKQHGARAKTAAQPVRIMVFFDLVQDLDLALPIIDELRARPGVKLRVVVSAWLTWRSPRVLSELEARNLLAELVDRDAVERGEEPSLDGVDAVLTVVETSLPPHARAHALFRRARARGIATFSLQHGVENIGLTHVEREADDDPQIISDHLFVWFSRDRAPDVAPDTLKPRLIHVGRPVRAPQVRDLRGTFAAFERVAAVFENLHWTRFDESYRRRFVADFVAFAQSDPSMAVVLKPHHAGLWSVRFRDQFPDWPSNLILADPTDPFWEPFTAPSIIRIADIVITTPSTVALDAAAAGKPVAVAAYGLDLPAYAPLPLLQSAEDWLSFARMVRSADDARRRADFMMSTSRGDLPERAAVTYLLAVARGRAGEDRRVAHA